MADIVQLQEGGVGKYMKTHAKAVDGLNESIQSQLNGDVIVLYDGLTTTKGVYFDDSQSYAILPNRKLLNLVMVWSGYEVGGSPKSYGGRTMMYEGESVRKMQASGISMRELFQYGVASGNICCKDIVFSSAGITGSANNSTTPSGGKDNRNIVLRYVAVTYAKE